jgi:hypothetical protein
MPRLHLAAALSALVLSAGCGSSSAAAPPSREPTPVVIDPFGEARTLRLPFDAYKPSASHLELIRQAIEILTSRCARARGYERPPLPPVNVIDAPDRRRYGVIEIEVARAVGYRLPRTSGEKALRQAADTRKGDLSRAARAAIGECLDQSNARVYAKDDQPGLLVQLEKESFEGTRRNDPKVKAVFADWRTCMTQKGRRGYADPMEAIGDDRWQGPRIDKAEIDTAVADVECKQKVGLVATWHEEEKAFQAKAVAQHHSYFAQVRQTLQQEETTARNIISGPSCVIGCGSSAGPRTGG